MKFGSLSIIAASIALSACVTTGPTVGDVTPIKLTRPIRADDKPYIGERDEAHSWSAEIWRTHKLRRYCGWEIGAARSGHFTKDGLVTMFIAPPCMHLHNPGAPGKTPAQQAQDRDYLSSFGIWRLDAENIPEKKIIDLGKGCLMPNDAVVADFNNDGIDDVFVACEGVPKWAVGGGGELLEQSWIVLSDGKGGFTSKPFGEKGHSLNATAADVNGDGYLDILGSNMVGGPSVFFYINQKDGTFKKEAIKTKGSVNFNNNRELYNIAELHDVDGDGIVDIAVNGPGKDGAVLFGDSDGSFGREQMVIPKVPGRNTPFAFFPVTNNGERILYVTRTSDNTSGLGGDQNGTDMTQTVQAINLTTGKATIAHDHVLEKGRGETALESGWMVVTRNGQKGITPVDGQFKKLFITDGKLVEPK